MPANDLAVAVLAAGKGTRLKSSLAKVLHRAGGRALLEHVLRACAPLKAKRTVDRKSTRLNSSHLVISYAVFCLKKKKKNPTCHIPRANKTRQCQQSSRRLC